MCRLLGLPAGREPISASFWLLDAPDPLRVQSRRNADGSGSDSSIPRARPSSVHAPALQALPSVVVASEELDGESGRHTAAALPGSTRRARGNDA